MNKIISEKTVTTVTKTMDIGHGFEVSYEFKNNKFSFLGFKKTYKKKDYRFSYYKPLEVEELKNLHWSDHHLVKCHIFKSEKELLEFTDYKNLYYVGCGYDGLVRNWDFKLISCVHKFDYSYCKIWQKIFTLEECKKIKERLNTDYILNCEIVEIPYYNRDPGETHSLEITFKLTQNIYDECIDEFNSENDVVRNKMFEKLLK